LDEDVVNYMKDAVGGYYVGLDKPSAVYIDGGLLQICKQFYIVRRISVVIGLQLAK